jgi:hypothetical protein
MSSRDIRSRRGGAHSLRRQAGHSAPRLKPIRFDDRWRAASPTLKLRIDQLVTLIETWETGTRERRRRPKDFETFRRAVECIVCNLVAVSMADHRRRLAIRLENAASQTVPILGKPSRTVIEALIGLGLVSKVRGYPYRGLTTIAATPTMMEFIKVKPNDWKSLSLEGPTKLAFLRTNDSQKLLRSRAPNSRWLVKVTNEMRSINEAIQRADISFGARSAFHIIDRTNKPTATLVTKLHLSLYRVFNGTWDEGGRQFGGLWQTMERAERFKRITIAGKRIAVVDYCQLFIRLAYARARVTPPKGDLYAVSLGDTRRPNWKAIRAARKKLVNALFFLNRPLQQWPGQDIKERSEIRGAFPPGTRPRDAVKDIMEHHKGIAGQFGVGIGLKLMRTESDLITRVVLALNRRGIIALPVHDAVIVAANKARITKVVMEREAKRLVGAVMPTEIQKTPY